MKLIINWAIKKQFVLCVVILSLFNCKYDLKQDKIALNVFNQEVPTSNFLDKAFINKYVTKVISFQIENDVHTSNQTVDYPQGWLPSTFYVSILPFAEVSKDALVKEKLIKIVHDWAQNHTWGDKYKYLTKEMNANDAWKLGPRVHHGDDMACAQVYMDYYAMVDQNKIYTEDLSKRIDTLKVVKTKEVLWDWSDALFMGPPAVAKLASVENNKEVADFLHSNYWTAVSYLKNESYGLFHRDSKYFADGSLGKEPNGKPVFWGRGNGWVIAGLARLIPHLDDNDPQKAKYVSLFKEMAEKIKAVQGTDGMWRSSLLDPESFPIKETSGTGMFTYAMAWGVNQGYLPYNEYAKTIQDAWNGLSLCLDYKTGKLGFVQTIGQAPVNEISADNFNSYGSGFYVLAGTEILKMIDSDDYIASNK